MSKFSENNLSQNKALASNNFTSGFKINHTFSHLVNNIHTSGNSVNNLNNPINNYDSFENSSNKFNNNLASSINKFNSSGVQVPVCLVPAQQP